MSRLAKAVAAIAAISVLSAPLMGDAAADQRRAQNRLLATRAARADAMRQLAERIKGLQITASTSVKDFVTESDTIDTELRAFLAGVREKGRPVYNEDGTVEVTLEVTLETVIATLKQIHERSYRGDRFKAQDFEQITLRTEQTVLTATGSGAPRPEFVPGNEGVTVTAEAAYDSIRYMSPAAKAYWLENVTPQGRLMAVRGAQVDAMRKLAERIAGVNISSNTTVRDFVTESDDVNVDMRTFLRGAREVRVSYTEDEPVVEVTMAVTLRTVYATLKEWGETHYKGNRAVVSQIQELSVRSEDKVIEETGQSVVAARFLKTGAAPVARPAGPSVPDWASRKLRAVGNAALDTTNPNQAQARLMAFRGAEMDARRKLAEELSGLMITSNTSVRDFVTQNDDIRTSMDTFQVGAAPVEGSQKLLEDGTAEVTVEIDLAPLWNMVTYYQRSQSITIR